MIKAFISTFCMSVSCLMAAATISLEDYAAMVGNVDPKTNRIATLNDNGAQMCFTTEITEAFLEHCLGPNCTYVLEIGCAYGVKASQIVQTGVFLVANDIDPRHLNIMKECFDQLSKTSPDFKNVRYIEGNFATVNQEQIGTRKYDAILCESVLHFMRPEEVRQTLNIFNTSLNKGGKVYITVVSHYLQPFRETFEANKTNGMEWPGLFEDLEGISPVIYNVVDEEILARELKNAGFKIVTLKYIPKPLLEKEYQHNNRDWLIAIAEKTGTP
jgi:SAM-dependent methyltransferase